MVMKIMTVISRLPMMESLYALKVSFLKRTVTRPVTVPREKGSCLKILKIILFVKWYELIGFDSTGMARGPVFCAGPS